ncbi:MAG: hypothetical protein C0507_24685 [Cyanobacteria bacterium PR.3.49]|nr:hypothetical protein [Cyanobacteria bacterium PR.3.49]
MFQFQENDPALMVLAVLILQSIIGIAEILEEKKVIPGYLVKARAQFRDKPAKWLLITAPLILFSMGAIWLVLRQFPIKISNDLLIKIIIGFYLTSMCMSVLRWRNANRGVRKHTESAQALINQAESELKTLEDGPAIEDENLDRTILNAKLKLAKAREILGVKKDDPNDR